VLCVQRLRDEGLTRLSLQVTHLEQEREQLKSSLKRESNEKDEMKAEVSDIYNLNYSLLVIQKNSFAIINKRLT
jgi:hypothetical protein